MSKRLNEPSYSVDGVEEAITSKDFTPSNKAVDSAKFESNSSQSTKKLKPNECMIETQTINVELQQLIIHNNKYRLIEEIANGAFATVFKAEEISTKKMLL